MEKSKRWPGEIRATKTHTVGKGYKNRTKFKLKKSDLSEEPWFLPAGYGNV